MKSLSLIILLVSLMVMIRPTWTAEAQWPCPPVTSPTATNIIQKDGYQAWLDFRPYWQQCAEGAPIIGVDLGEGIASLQFDTYIRYALYAYGVNGGVYQINVATNQTITIVYPNQPPGDPGEAHASESQPNSPPPTTTPAVINTPTLPVIQRQPLLFFFRVRLIGWF